MTKSTLTISERGTLTWRNEKGEIHRDNDLPAVIYPSGTKIWYINGKRHRDNDKPAAIDSEGYKEWWTNNKFVKNNYND